MLVLGALPDGTLITASYGTSQSHHAPQDWEVIHEAQRGTLTTFDLLRVVNVPATTAYFPSGLPVLKRFPAERMPEIVAARVVAQAELARRAKRGW